MLNRMISLFLCIVMVISMVPVQAFATEDVTEPTETVTEPTEETTVPTEPVTEPTEETIAPTEAATEHAQGETAPTEETIAKEPEVIPVESVIISQADGITELAVGETLQLTATVLPENATDKTVTWSSSDESVATVDANGFITALSEGSVSVYAVCNEAQGSYALDVIRPEVTAPVETETDETDTEVSELKYSILIHYYNAESTSASMGYKISDDEWQYIPLAENTSHPGWYDVNVMDSDGIALCYFTVGDIQTEEFVVDGSNGTVEFWYLNDELVTEVPLLWSEPPTVEESKEITVHFYNLEEWTVVNAYIQNSAESDNEYPGVTLEQSAEHKNWYDVSIVDNDGVFTCTFNDGINQTDALSIEYTDENTEFWYLNDTITEKAPELWTSPPEVTRAQWIQELVEVFSMTVEEDNYPDNYYSDLTGEEEYYRDIMVAVEFGVIDLDAGLPFRPEEAATREFAAHTLNFALGFQLGEDTSYTFAESAEVTYPDDIQIAVNRGWFALFDGNFLPEEAITKEEKTIMLSDAEAVLALDVPDDTKENSSTFAEGVIEVPMGTDVSMNENGELVILDSPIALKPGDIFIAYDGGFPVAFVATAVRVDGDNLIVSVTTEGAENAIADLYFTGTIEADLENFVPSEATTLMLGPYRVDSGITTYGVDYDSAKKTLNASKTFTIKDQLKATLDCDIENVKLDMHVDKANDVCTAEFSGTTNATFSVHGDLLEALTTSDAITIGYVPILFGTCYYEMMVEYSLNGEISLVWKGDIKAGFSYSSGDFRLIKEFTKKSFSFSAEVSAKLGIRTEIGMDLWLLKASIWAAVGAQMNMKDIIYTDGTPARCRDYEGFLYVNVGAKAKIFGVKEYKVEEELLKKSNSPVRVHYHIEDNVLVSKCARSDEFSSYTTDPSSKNFNNSYGNVSSTYTDKNGNSVKLYEYTLDENNQATITKYNGSAYALSIPSMIDGYTVVSIEGAFRNNTKLGTVRIPNTVTTIGTAAFYSCENLVCVIMPNSVTTIGRSAFEYCEKLDITIPNGVTTIEFMAFFGCSSLGPTITLQASGIKIGGNAFGDCTNLETVYLPDSALLGPHPFDGDSIEVVVTCDTGKIREGFLAVSDDYYGEPGFGVKKVKISEGISTIGKSAFEGGARYYPTILESVELPSTVTTIGDYAFNKCASLENINIPLGVTNIGDSVFSYCTNLKKINIHENIKTIGYSAFSDCQSLTDVTFAEGLTTIHDGAFANTALTELILPNSVITLEHSAFGNNDLLTSVEIGSGLATVDDNPFMNCKNLTTLRISSENQSFVVEDNILFDADQTKLICCPAGRTANYTIPENVITIGEYAFYGCEISEIDLPKNMTSIGAKAFYECIGLSSMTIPESVTSIGQGAFNNCNKLERIIIPESVTSIGEGAFYNCDSLETITIPNNVTIIDYSCFKSCDLLSDVDLGKGLTTIPSGVFQDCPALVKVTIPASVTSISTHAFSYPNKITIYGISGSYAQTYAKQNGFSFMGHSVHATTVVLNPVELTMSRGVESTLDLMVAPEDHTDTIIWESSDSSIVTVTDKGIVKAVGNGTATVKVIVGFISATCQITVVEPVSYISLNEYNLTMQKQEKYQLIATIYPENAYNQVLSWNSSDPAVASVDENGLVTALASGTATITAVASDGSGVYESCLVKVLKEPVIITDVTQFESTHDYDNNCLDSWIYTAEDAIKLKVTFDSRTMFESGYDYLNIFDGYGTLVGSYTGTELSGKTITVFGNTIIIRLDTDESYTEWGFKVTKIEAIEEHDHVYTEEVTDPTCTDDGYTTHICSICDDTVVDTYVDALGHTYQNDVCERCGKIDPSTGIIDNGICGDNLTWTLDNEGLLTISGIGDMVDYQWEFPPWLNADIYVKHLVVEEGVSAIGDYAFASCENLEEVILPKSLTSIGVGAFYFCHSLTELTIPKNVAKLGNAAFYACTALKSIRFTGDAPLFESESLYNNICTVYYPDGNDTWTDEIRQDYGGTITWVAISNAVENRVEVCSEELGNHRSVWIDGMEYSVQQNGNSSYIDLPDSNAKTMVVYTYHVVDSSDIHTQYPVSMKVWTLSNKAGLYTATRVEELDNILQYSGASIRVTGKKGIRMITSMNQTKKNDLISDGLAGYTLKEYGTVVAWASQLGDKALVLGKPYAKSNYAYKKGVADPVFAYNGNLMQYTNVLVGFSTAQCKNNLVMRPYMILEDEEGNDITIYGGTVTRSIGYIAYQNRAAFTPGTDAYKYVWDIIHSVYGNAYDAEYVA